MFVLFARSVCLFIIGVKQLATVVSSRRFFPKERERGGEGERTPERQRQREVDGPGLNKHRRIS